MQPLYLNLVGFLGIRVGLGCDRWSLDLTQLPEEAHLVALAGPNGRGKTTLIDNLHPYLCLPSRSGQRLSGFSYYEHVYLPESEKDLIWQHEGQRYRSHVVIRLNGRRSTEAYLWRYTEQGHWQPVVLADGTMADGKLETYQRCVETICGSAETFFTSVFSAQGKRPLSEYRNAEIKHLLADLLGLDQVRELGQQAGEVRRQLKVGLSGLRQRQQEQVRERERLHQAHTEVADAPTWVATGEAKCLRLKDQLDLRRKTWTALEGERTQRQNVESRRDQLLDELQALDVSGEQALDLLVQQQAGELQREQRLEQRIAARQQVELNRRQQLDEQRLGLEQLIRLAPSLAWARRRLPLAEFARQQWQARLHRAHERARELVSVRVESDALAQRQTRLLRDIEQADATLADLRQRQTLIQQVPCVGTELQGHCPLLRHAHQAQAQWSDAERAREQLFQERAQLYAQQEQLQPLLVPAEHIQKAIVLMEAALELAQWRVERMRALLARRDELAQAQGLLDEVNQALATAIPVLQTADEQAEHAQIIATTTALDEAHAAEYARQQACRQRLQAELAALPAAWEAQPWQAAQQALTQATQALELAQADVAYAHQAAHQHMQLTQQQRALMTQQQHVDAQLTRIEQALTHWQLFARCMSPDGLIALAIDDAGPTLASLTNALLLACYGPRFTVSIRTLRPTCTGNLREGFDIMVHDADVGVSRSVGWMSGGERIWINECMVRAVALYLAQHSGRRYDTLFSDEADGALDAEHKRMFIAMKREALHLGGYQREYFVSQTRELTAMADAVIDLEAPVLVGV